MTTMPSTTLMGRTFSGRLYSSSLPASRKLGRGRALSKTCFTTALKAVKCVVATTAAPEGSMSTTMVPAVDHPCSTPPNHTGTKDDALVPGARAKRKTSGSDRQVTGTRRRAFPALEGTMAVWDALPHEPISVHGEPALAMTLTSVTSVVSSGKDSMPRPASPLALAIPAARAASAAAANGDASLASQRVVVMTAPLAVASSRRRLPAPSAMATPVPAATVPEPSNGVACTLASWPE
mmetsp:Transcript_8232/g.32459  ORF Transcript_8232/g.32459 Transcript_8232/m.32459 type:complete len:237 (-) Transcript_8232:116-826(-)